MTRNRVELLLREIVMMMVGEDDDDNTVGSGCFLTYY